MRNPNRRTRTIVLALVIGVLAGACDSPNTATTPTKAGQVGPGGGTVIYVDAGGFPCGANLEQTCTYIEVSPGDAQVERGWSLNDTGRVGIGQEPPRENVTRYHAIGAGEHNSLRIAQSEGVGDQSTSAAIYSLEYSTPTAGDWYLPSIDELQLIYDNQALIDGISAENSYWSSTEGSPVDAWGIYFASGLVSSNYKWRAATYKVRPVRAG